MDYVEYACNTLKTNGYRITAPRTHVLTLLDGEERAPQFFGQTRGEPPPVETEGEGDLPSVGQEISDDWEGTSADTGEVNGRASSKSSQLLQDRRDLISG
jgi:hypothetical protein